MICPGRNHRFRQLGYTFLEIGMALGIIAIAFAAIIPVVSSSQSERKLRTTMEDIHQTVRAARLTAEKTGLPQAILIHAEGLTSGKQFVPMPPATALFIRYPQGDWQPADGQSWPVLSFGAVVPASLRLEHQGKWLEADFDFLTGSVATERYSF